MSHKSISNIDEKVIKDFGNEWGNFDQSIINDKDLIKAFNQYFQIFPKNYLNKNMEGFDMGCGSGRWSKLVAPKVKKLNCIDPSLEALNVAKKNLINNKNLIFHNKSVNEKILEPDSQDFGYCLGVLHHITETQKGIESCYNILKKNSPFLIYLYYKFDNKPFWFKIIWKLSDYFRKLISKLPFRIKKIITFFIALTIYFPLAKISKLFNYFGFNVNNFPLSDYKNKNFYFMATDSLDRFGTKLEKRFTKNEIKNMLLKAGFVDIMFSKNTPYWVAIAWKK
ncbi:class I SAM-dependent methyltransferase [Candidatus Pelagibacter sp.]|nr:class I SAM-dependent methyltransferase [Candidatus Pelagibacter sp.]